MPDSSENHGETQSIGGVYYLLIVNRPTGLNDGCRPLAGNLLNAVGERKKGVRGGHCSLEWKDGFHGADLAGIYARHLPGTDANRLPITSVHDGVRLHVFAHYPG